MTKTTKDLVYALIDDIAGDAECARRIRAKFNQETLPKLKDVPHWKTPISEKEYAGMRQRIETDLPAFLKRLEKIGRPAAVEAD